MKAIRLRIICCLLACLMMGTVLFGCGEKTPDEPETPAPSDPGTPSAPTEPDEQEGEIDYLLRVPEDNFGGESFTILCRADKEYEMVAEDGASTVVDRAVFARNNRVEARYGVDIVTYPVNGHWESRTEFVNTLARSVSTGDNAYQLSATHMAYNANISMNEQYLDLRSLDSIDLEADWWSQSFVKNCTVYDKLFMVTGDLALTMWEGLYATFFNRQMAVDYGTDDLYELVRNGDWTLEELTYITSGTHMDDGNGTPDAADTFGLLINRHSMRTFITSCDLPLAARNEEGGYDLVFMDATHAEKVTNVYDALYELIYENDGTFDSKLPDGDYSEMVDVFTGGRALFMLGTLDNSTALRQADLQFGILPFPKYDKEQTSYLAHSYDGLSSFGIPASVADAEMCARILDALSAESKTSVIPAYYEIVLQGRVAQDGDSKEMLTLIRQNLYFDFGFVYSNALRNDSITAGPFAFFGDQLRNQATSLSAPYASVVDVFETMLEDTMENFAE